MCTRVVCKLRGQDLVLEIETSFDKMHLLFTFLSIFIFLSGILLKNMESLHAIFTVYNKKVWRSGVT